MVLVMEPFEKLEEFIRSRYYSELLKSIKEEKALVIDFSVLDRFDPIMADSFLEKPDEMMKQFNIAAENVAKGGMEIEKVTVRLRNLPESRGIRIRNLRSKHMNRMWTIDAVIMHKPISCDGCGRRGDFKLVGKKMVDIRWIQGVEPFEITSGEQPGEIAIVLREDLTVPLMQRKSDPGTQLRVVGILKELPKRIKGKLTTKLDMYMDA